MVQITLKIFVINGFSIKINKCLIKENLLNLKTKIHFVSWTHGRWSFGEPVWKNTLTLWR